MLAKGRDTYKYFTKNHMLYERNQVSMLYIPLLMFAQFDKNDSVIEVLFLITEKGGTLQVIILLQLSHNVHSL